MEIGHSKEEVKLFEAVKKLFDTLYARGILDFEAHLSHNNAYFSGRENKRATYVTIEIKPDLDKINPLSPNFDPQYVDTIWKAANIEDIRKYLGAPNLVIEVYYDWELTDEKKWTKMNVNFQKITEEIVQEIKLKNNLKMSSESLYDTYDFGVYPRVRETEGRIIIEILSNKHMCSDLSKHTIKNITLEILNKYGINKQNVIIDNRLCNLGGY